MRDAVVDVGDRRRGVRVLRVRPDGVGQVEVRMAEQEQNGKMECLHLSWYGEGGVMICRRCGAQRMPMPWENAWADTADVDALRIRHDGLDGDV